MTDAEQQTAAVWKLTPGGGFVQVSRPGAPIAAQWIAPPIWARPTDRDEWADAHPTTRPELGHDEIREGLALLAQVPEVCGTQAPVLIVAAKAVLLRGDGAAAHVLRLLRAEFGS